MNRKQVDTIWLCISIVSFLLFSCSFLLMPIESETATDSLSIYSLIAGLMFWSFLILGIVSQVVLALRRKKWYVLNKLKYRKSIKKVGLITFFKNTFAIIADVMMIFSLISLIVVMIATGGTGYLCFIFVSAFTFSFSMHCILNGKIYFHVLNQEQMLKLVEKERANKQKKEGVRKDG